MKVFSLIAASLLLSVASATATVNYSLTINFSPNDKGQTFYLYDFDTRECLDSIVASDGVAVLKGTVEQPVIAMLKGDGNDTDIIFLEEPGTVLMDRNTNYPSGTPANDALVAFAQKMDELSARTPQNAAEQEALMTEYYGLIENTRNDNIDNLMGDYIFMNTLNDYTAAEIEKEIAARPTLGTYKRVNDALESARLRNATMPGGKMIDFEVTYNGKTERLSDYVGKGRYVLVDFWASWCGPCMRQTPFLKELYKEYGPEGTNQLDILGVAVWDKPEDTLRAIKSHDITWPCIIDAQKMPTDLYGIQGIPCIILFGPDGTILSRDLQSQELVDDVKKYLNK